MNEKRKLKWKNWYWIIVVILVFFISSWGGVGLTRSYYKNKYAELDSIYASKDSLIAQQDRLIKASEDYILELDDSIENLSSANRERNANIRWKERLVYIAIDNDYVSNAKRIADSANRFYSRDHDPR